MMANHLLRNHGSDGPEERLAPPRGRDRACPRLDTHEGADACGIYPRFSFSRRFEVYPRSLFEKSPLPPRHPRELDEASAAPRLCAHTSHATVIPTAHAARPQGVRDICCSRPVCSPGAEGVGLVGPQEVVEEEPDHDESEDDETPEPNLGIDHRASLRTAPCHGSPTVTGFMSFRRESPGSSLVWSGGSVRAQGRSWTSSKRTPGTDRERTNCEYEAAARVRG